MSARRPAYSLPEVRIDWVEFKDGSTLGGPVFVCRPGGCGRAEAACKPLPKGGEPTRYCRVTAARNAAALRLAQFLKWEWKP